ncbi:MAG: hypothetical protein QGF36_03685 [Candidatus Marinimicrobia bacterium]|nr:hypothetical protein [Candidatus Neomarinimicrobiota bacterium]
MKTFISNLFIILFFGLIPCGCENDPTSTPEGHTDADGFILEDKDGNVIYKEFEGATEGSISLVQGAVLELSVHFLDHEGNEIEDEDDDHDHDHDHDHEGEESELRITEFDDSIATIEVKDHDEEHCDEITVQADCEASDHCEWHADDNACEAEAHDEEHCDEITVQADCEASDHCEWHADDNACEAEAHNEEHCDEITVQADCEASDHCEWHADDNACEAEAHDEEHGGLILHITGKSVGSTDFKLELMHGDHADYTSSKNIPVTVNAQN